jgi:type II restriction enzyme
MNAFLDENISSGSYDDIRRKDLILPVTAGVILKSAGKLNAATNDGTRAYALDPEFALQIRRFGTPAWGPALKRLMSEKVALADELRKLRELARIPVTIEGQTVLFSPGVHNRIQKAVIEQFLPLFGHGAKVLYIGDTEHKSLFLDAATLEAVGFFELSHDKLPDVLAYSPSENWLYLIEAVHSANPISALRKVTLERLIKTCKAGIVFVTAFLTRDAFRKFSGDIAWETEVWIAEDPRHLIHFNGDRFLGPH